MTLEQLHRDLVDEMQLQLKTLRAELVEELVDRLCRRKERPPPKPKGVKEMDGKEDSQRSEGGRGLSSLERIRPPSKPAVQLLAEAAQAAQAAQAGGPEMDARRCLLTEVDEQSVIDTAGSGLFPDCRSESGREILSLALEAETCRGRMIEWLNSNAFNYIVSLLVFLNAIVIGAQTNYSAQHGGASSMPLADPINHAFCLIFTAEVCAKLYAYGCIHFFWQDGDWKWNCFDTVVVLLQWADYAAEQMPNHILQGGNLGMCLRMLRLARIMRLARVIHLMVELRSMVASIVACLRPLIWASVLFGMLVYGVAVTLTESANHFRADHSGEPVAALDLYFCSLGTAAITLWMCITGGIDWKNVADPLINDVSPLMGAFITAYVAFSVLAMMNVITGIFVENAAAFSREDKDNYVVSHVLNLFTKSALNEKDELTLEEFQRMLETRELRELFQAVDVDVNDAESLFRLLDVDETGTLSPSELLDGWIRLRGPSKALDLAVLMSDSARMDAKLDWLCEVMNKHEEALDVATAKPRRTSFKRQRATSIALRLKEKIQQTRSQGSSRSSSLTYGLRELPKSLPL